MKILVVDDSNAVHATAKAGLGKEWEIVSAMSALEAAPLVLSESPDVILLDVEMPGMSGIEFAYILSTSEKGSRIPVLMLSGNSTAFDKASGECAGADGYITKPFVISEVKEKILEVVDAEGR